MTITRFMGNERFLSNFYPCCVVLDDVAYGDIEHAYQAAKTLSLSERRTIQQARTPGIAKRCGRSLTMRPDWDVVKLSIMRDLVQQKFRCGSVLSEMLSATRAEDLIEGNTWHDLYWGRCDCVRHLGQGQNMLGVLLMQQRADLQKEMVRARRIRI